MAPKREHVIKLRPVFIQIYVSENHLLHSHFVITSLCAIFYIPFYMIQHLSGTYLYPLNSYSLLNLSADLAFKFHFKLV